MQPTRCLTFRWAKQCCQLWLKNFFGLILSLWWKFSTIFPLNLLTCKIFVFNIVPLSSVWYKLYHWLILTLSMTSLFDGTAHLYTVWKCVHWIPKFPICLWTFTQLCISTLCKSYFFVDKALLTICSWYYTIFLDTDYNSSKIFLWNTFVLYCLQCCINLMVSFIVEASHSELSRMLFMPFSCLTFLLQISGLNSGRGLKITIYAANANGRSPNVILEGFTLKVAELQVGK